MVIYIINLFIDGENWDIEVSGLFKANYLFGIEIEIF